MFKKTKEPNVNLLLTVRYSHCLSTRLKRLRCYFFADLNLAQRALCAAAIFLRAARLIFRFFGLACFRYRHLQTPQAPHSILTTAVLLDLFPLSTA
jgi:hypothetical protein